MKMKWLKILGVFLAGMAIATGILFGISRNYSVPECSPISQLGQSSETVTIGEAPLAGASVNPLNGE